jgi:hypothetical protein
MPPPAIATLLAWLATLFRASASVRLENLALRHQLAVYKQMVIAHGSIRATGCYGSGSPVCGLAGKRHWRLSSPVP